MAGGVRGRPNVRIREAILYCARSQCKEQLKHDRLHIEV